VATAIVGGAVANKPLNGGESWVRLSWILGLRRLGFEAYFVEMLDTSTCVDAAGEPAAFADSANASQLDTVVREFGLEGRVALLDDRGGWLHGLGLGELGEHFGEAEVLFDLSGHLGSLSVAASARRRVYVDLDPAFTQAWHADRALSFTLSGYDSYVTVGLNVGAAAWPIPLAGLEWIPTLPPVLLEEWRSEPVVHASDRDSPYRFTTIATWRSPFGAISIDGRTLALKHHEFRRVIALPEEVAGAEFELALDIHDADAADRDALRAHGWSVASPAIVAATPGSFRDYVRGSDAEFSVAQPAYVETASGWFSDRTAAYLAAGRPALVQDTGLGSALARGEGLLTFATPGEAAEGARRLVAEPLAHAEAARRFAETHLDSDLVLARLLEALGIGG
jgi:hypothetical protein